MLRRHQTQALSVVLLFFVANGFSQTPPALSQRINACFTASKHELAENLCLFYNNRFSWASSYGAVDRYASGTYTISNDTIYLDSHRPPPFIIRGASIKTIPAGKIQLVFKRAGRHASYINAEIGTTSLTGVDRLKKSGEDFVTTIPAPAQRSIRLEHTLFDEQGADYPLPASGNQYTITVSDSIGQTAFEHLALEWRGLDLKPAGENTSTVFRFTASYPSYDDVPWTAESKPSREVFDQWSKVQQNAFKGIMDKMEAAEKLAAATAVLMKKKFVVYNWEAARSAAANDQSGIIVLLGADSVEANTEGSGDSVAVPRKESLADRYFRYFADDMKLPAFLQLNTKDAESTFKVSVLPAQIILDPNGRPLYKNEGSVMEAETLHSVWQRIESQEEARRIDSLVQQSTQIGADSARLFHQIETMNGWDASSRKALEDAGIDKRSLVDTAVQRYVSRQAFNANNYDFVSAAYFPEDSWRYYAGNNQQSVATPAVRYLVDHFGDRQKASAVTNKMINDSLINRAYFGLLSLLGYARLGGNAPDTAVLDLKKMVTGITHYMDFFTTISAIQGEIELAAYKSLPLAKRKELIPGFLRDFFGDALPAKATVDAASAAIYKSMRAANNQLMIRNYLGADSTERRFLQIGNSVAGYFLTMQAKILLDASPDANIRLNMLQQSGAFSLLETAAGYNAVVESYLLRRNYAYALYLSGKNQTAVTLMQQVIADMKQPANKYLATEERLKLANENLRAMKEGRAITWTVAGLTDY
jgi:hypothetical protein